MVGTFAVTALVACQARLPEWPAYCESLLGVAVLHQAHPEFTAWLQQVVANAANQQKQQQQQQSLPQQPSPQAPLQPPPQPPTTSTFMSKPLTAVANHRQAAAAAAASPSTASTVSAAVAAAAAAADTKRRLHSLNIATLLDAAGNSTNQPATFMTPSEATQDAILFHINNLTTANLGSKLSAFRQACSPACYPWLAQYMVVKRVSIEPNFHATYQQLLAALAEPALYDGVLRETYANVRVLLVSDKTLTSSTERTLLKNLGMWLGGLTLARNKPILYRHLSIKDLLIDGYESNRLLVVIPFTCKVLEQSAASTVFRPTNPWMLAILRLLVELYQYADLKLNLKFEVEVLCKNLQVEIKGTGCVCVLCMWC